MQPFKVEHKVEPVGLDAPEESRSCVDWQKCAPVAADTSSPDVF
jgi:hypothetical protein